MGDNMKKVLILMCICLLCFGCGKANQTEKEPTTFSDIDDIVDMPTEEEPKVDTNIVPEGTG